MDVVRRRPALALWLVAHIALVFVDMTSGAGGACDLGYINVTGSDGNVTTFCRCSANANPEYYSVGGSLGSECACVAGYYSSSALAWNVSCQLCPAGSYCSGDQSITACTTGSTSPAGSSSVSSCFCQPGYTGNGGSSGCEACLVGTYKPENGTLACTECPVATYNDATAASSATSCTGICCSVMWLLDGPVPGTDILLSMFQIVPPTPTQVQALGLSRIVLAILGTPETREGRAPLAQPAHTMRTRAQPSVRTAKQRHIRQQLQPQRSRCASRAQSFTTHPEVATQRRIACVWWGIRRMARSACRVR